MLAFALFCCIQKRNKKKKSATQETDIIHFDEHKKVKETIVPGPFGQQAVVVTVEDDVHVDAEIRKNETVGHHGLHAKSPSSSAHEAEQAGNSSSTEVVGGTATSPGGEQQHHQQQLDNKS